jgi:hypothetical protein
MTCLPVQPMPVVRFLQSVAMQPLSIHLGGR